MVAHIVVSGCYDAHVASTMPFDSVSQQEQRANVAGHPRLDEFLRGMVDWRCQPLDIAIERRRNRGKIDRQNSLTRDAIEIPTYAQEVVGAPAEHKLARALTAASGVGLMHPAIRFIAFDQTVQ